MITRRFCKKLLEELIKDNITIINLNNYTPDIQILKKYLSSVSSNYIFRKGFKEDTGLRFKNIISDLENKKSRKYPKILKTKKIKKFQQ